MGRGWEGHAEDQVPPTPLLRGWGTEGKSRISFLSGKQRWGHHFVDLLTVTILGWVGGTWKEGAKPAT